MYDWLLVLALMMVGSVPIVAVMGDAVDTGNPFYRALLVLVALVFFGGFWRYGGQTPGMRAWRLLLTTADGRQLNTVQTLTRFVCAIAATLPLGLGFWWQLIDRDSLCWHDRWSGTRLRVLPKRRS